MVKSSYATKVSQSQDSDKSIPPSELKLINELPKFAKSLATMFEKISSDGTSNLSEIFPNKPSAKQCIYTLVAYGQLTIILSILSNAIWNAMSLHLNPLNVVYQMDDYDDLIVLILHLLMNQTNILIPTNIRDAIRQKVSDRQNYAKNYLGMMSKKSQINDAYINLKKKNDESEISENDLKKQLAHDKSESINFLKIMKKLEILKDRGVSNSLFESLISLTIQICCNQSATSLSRKITPNKSSIKSVIEELIATDDGFVIQNKRYSNKLSTYNENSIDENTLLQFEQILSDLSANNLKTEPSDRQIKRLKSSPTVYDTWKYFQSREMNLFANRKHILKEYKKSISETLSAKDIETIIDDMEIPNDIQNVIDGLDENSDISNSDDDDESTETKKSEYTIKEEYDISEVIPTLEKVHQSLVTANLSNQWKPLFDKIEFKSYDTNHHTVKIKKFVDQCNGLIDEYNTLKQSGSQDHHKMNQLYDRIKNLQQKIDRLKTSIKTNAEKNITDTMNRVRQIVSECGIYVSTFTPKNTSVLSFPFGLMYNSSFDDDNLTDEGHIPNNNNNRKPLLYWGSGNILSNPWKIIDDFKSKYSISRRVKKFDSCTSCSHTTPRDIQNFEKDSSIGDDDETIITIDDVLDIIGNEIVNHDLPIENLPTPIAKFIRNPRLNVTNVIKKFDCFKIPHYNGSPIIICSSLAETGKCEGSHYPYMYRVLTLYNSIKDPAEDMNHPKNMLSLLVCFAAVISSNLI